MLNIVKSGMAFLSLISITTGALAQVPVIPGAAGYGMNTPAGRGGKIMRVTNLRADGEGSLRSCVEASGPRVCVFEVSGTINMKSTLVAKNPNLTIAGQTAPAPGIVLLGTTLAIKTSDVLVQHIAVRPGDDPDGPPPQARDAITIGGKLPVRNVVIDHCSLSWSPDENFSTFNNTDNVTISNSIIAQPVDRSLLNKDGYGYGVLIDSSNGESKISLTGNLFAHNYSRNPRSNASNFVFVNNVVYNAGAMAVMLYNDPGNPSRNSIVGNVFIDGPDSRAVPIRLAGSSAGDGDNEMLSGTRIYLSDNSWRGATSDPWSIVANQSNVSEAKLRTNNAPVWHSGLTAQSAADGSVLTKVLGNAGSRPTQRDSVDRKVVADVKNGRGEIINCIVDDGTTRCEKNAGGWPNLPSNSHSLILPDNSNGDDDGDGYTNLEEWLHVLAAEVEGRSVTSTPTPISAAPMPPEWQE